ncbi:bifunctional diaminohydroxyphosphoribosylaminopyrimidine deaminase/5-amino-6-(5-phosphoribosylamino)uracil reductase RibD [Staphylococcus equorum]|uniref:bifunctional diaminohydroxyphosphoribosylaminopyrimidine deaminase/5-amino-6-(5-phosphoribosylamino)uracil reductase RibD n=1 Tax=Staphylococcus equorum TaxID=246432 RepID=UPI000D1C8910|nr:bifunctional diaminohydroxyphosphoribosylaminopyrimidine deaminase/5-amino-6-(5-phosphoribosylamino)uracil reductase RibD [Staphylococcus equorum]PTE42783.1 bifunctional diaminohydroxyphosphoribosylaminopyrimidine deaminase/5-amino-6-(5-phosphoribosylamino)uracil reductase RibD [Staphylococcus equorum]PTE83409.1 bifunctional diaminohydroxyphosphoribosylaminopyrimidine deaminase/5-amino-6-(5-phosphoribosylamino)uracil reductase RibD [Staphylococcus equorum]PTF12047.1 bifunctional diaminohydrox
MSQYLNYAIQLAKMVSGQTGVNPPVGAVVVKDGRIVGIGAHLKKGDKHAEVQALDMAQDEAKDATIFISLEPCTHFGSTPPCVNKIIDFGIKKVIYAVKDTTLPSKGDEILQHAGIEVEFRHNAEAEDLYKDFFISKSKEVPEVSVKVACSLDGKQATDEGESKWITNKAVKADVFNLRHTHDAVLTGRGTLVADNPQYTTRIEEGKHPIKVILSQSGQIDFELDMFKNANTPIWIYTQNENLKTDIEQVEIIILTDCSIENILIDLYQKGIGKLLVEAGPTVTSAFLQSQYTNELILYYAPKIIGGSGSYQFYQTKNIFGLSEVPQFEIVNTQMLEQNIKLELRKK